MKIAYLHGLESNNLGPKNDWLHSIYDVFDPYIDYYEVNIYQSLKTKIIEFKPDLIIGSSMGGYFAHEIAKELNISAVLFNPALHSRSFDPDMTGHFLGNNNPNMYLVLGEKDTIIDPILTLNYIKKNNINNYTYTLLSHEHLTTVDVFKREINFFIETQIKKDFLPIN
jgi:predicted esterase YcpF (UPF0227 family)